MCNIINRTYRLILIGAAFSVYTLATADIIVDDELQDFKEKLIGDTSKSSFEEIFDFTAENKYKTTSAPVGQLDITFSNNRGGHAVCTGTLIHPKYLLTAYHCVHDDDDETNQVTSVSLWMDYQSRKLTAQAFAVKSKLHDHDKDLDYVILEVENNPSEIYGIAKPVDYTIQRQQELFVIHHPLGREKTLTRRYCRARGLPVGGIMSHACHTLKGSSGGPIFSDNNEKPSIVAIHTGFRKISGIKQNTATTLSAIIGDSCIVNKIASDLDPDTCFAEEVTTVE